MKAAEEDWWLPGQLPGLQEVPVATQKESGVLCFPSTRGLTPWVSLECTGLPVHHHLPEFTQTHVHRVGDLLCLQGVPDLPGAPQDEAGLMRKFET